METGCKLGSPDKFENDKLYSNATTQQNEREPGIVLDSRKNIMIKLVFYYDIYNCSQSHIIIVLNSIS